MGGRKLGGFSHTDALASVPDEAQIWFDHPDFQAPQHAPISILQHLYGEVEVRNGDGALSLTSYSTQHSDNGWNTVTLADGLFIGHLKHFNLIGQIGTTTLTPDNLFNGTSLNFEGVGDYALLQWNGSNWVVIQKGSYVNSDIGPSIT